MGCGAQEMLPASFGSGALLLENGDAQPIAGAAAATAGACAGHIGEVVAITAMATSVLTAGTRKLANQPIAGGAAVVVSISEIERSEMP